MIGLFLYQFLFILCLPIGALFFIVRFIKDKEDHQRWPERWGIPGHIRPEGKLIWMHGASVGECLSMLPLIHRLLEKDEKLHIMVTSGTVTSARLMATRLPERAFHHYLPVDVPGATTRLIRHFKPQAAYWFESEFWPTTLNAFKKAGVPLILLNGRISDRSFARWQKHPKFIKMMLSCFALTLGQSEEDRRRLEVLGSPSTACVGNIKCAAPASPFDPQELENMKAQIGNRPCWCGASTHHNEEEQLADVALSLKEDFPNLLTISVPRHPNRADEIQKMFESKGMKVARRSRGEEITNEVQVYLADTIGEMGLLYQLAPLVFVGGSLIDFGGQNMLEPMYWSRVVFVGPHTQNFRAFMASGKEKTALIEVQDKSELTNKVRYYLQNPNEQLAITERAHQMAISEMTVLDRLYDLLKERNFV